MVKYNVNVLYNNRNNYNSSTDFIVVVSDGAKSSALVVIDSSVSVNDLGSGVEYADVNSTTFINDQGVTEDSIILDANINVTDFGASSDLLELLFPGIVLSDIALGKDSISLEPTPITLNDRGTATDFMSYKPVANYNSKKSYNKKWDAGGASYNSYKHHIVMVADVGVGADMIDLSFSELMFADSGVGIDSTSVSPVVLGFSDKGVSRDFVSIISSVMVADVGVGADMMKDVTEFLASKTFFVTTHNIIEPLGVLVTRDNRRELLPATRDNVEEITGRHGEIDFGTEFKARMMELHIATDEGNSPIEKSRLERLFAMYLNPTKGAKALIFADDMDKSYTVKYSGKIDLTNHPTWFEFVLPFKMSDPFINGTFGKILVGSGKLINDGTFETGLIIEIAGPVTNPSLTIGGEILKYTGVIPSGQKLIIDTDKETVKIGSSNAIGGYNGVFPLLYPGETIVVSSNNVTIKWRDKWI